MTAIHNAVHFQQLPSITGNVEHQIIKISTNSTHYHIVNIYDRGRKCETDFYNALTVYSNLIVVGDFNAHHRLWGNPHTSTKGRNLIEALDNLNLTLHNDKSQTFIHRRGTSALDLTFTSANISHQFEWVNSEEYMMSDHCIIQLYAHSNIERPQSVPNNPRPRFNLKKADWLKFMILTDASIESLAISPTDPIGSYDKIEAAIISAAEESIPKSKPNPKGKHHNPWWNPDCTKAPPRNK